MSHILKYSVNKFEVLNRQKKNIFGKCIGNLFNKVSLDGKFVSFVVQVGGRILSIFTNRKRVFRDENEKKKHILVNVNQKIIRGLMVIFSINIPSYDEFNNISKSPKFYYKT